eukprot:scaffold46085_cov61-Phaeocystis_antarctica.AAC.2
MRDLSFASPPVGEDSAPAGGGGAKRAVRPSSPNVFPKRLSSFSAASRRRAGARATSPTSPTPQAPRSRISSRTRAPRPRAAASASAPASPTRSSLSVRTAGSAPAPSPSTSRSTPSGPLMVTSSS